MTLINIPFEGFYNSIWSDLLDSEVESFAEHEGEKQQSMEYNPEDYYPEPLRVDVSEWAWETLDYSAAFLDIARDYTEAFGEWLNKRAFELDADAPPCELKFERLDSPREYNFRTDDIDADISPAFIAWMKSQADTGKGAEPLADAIRRRHSSRSGFSSFYSNDIAEWKERAVNEWDFHELRTLLESVFGTPNELGDIYYTLADDSYSYFENAMNWTEYESRLNQERAEKLAEWLDLDPDAAAAWIAHNAEKAEPLLQLLPGDVTLPEMAYRCQKTPDLFAGH